MKSFEHFLQKACEEYFTQLNHEPTLADLKAICTTPIANVVWKALRVAETNRAKLKAKQTTKINGVSITKIKRLLSKTCENLLGKRIGDVINHINYIFKLCPTYGFEFHYGTRNGLYTKLEHTYDDNDIIVGAGFSKNKK